MKKIRLLHFDYDDLNNPFAGGGQAKATNEMYNRMSEKYDVTVITGNYPKAKIINKNIKYRRLGIGFLGPTISIFSFWILIPIYAFFNKNKFDLITEFFTAPIGPSFLPILVDKPVIAWGSFLDPEKMAEKYHLPFDIAANFLIKHYKYLVALTESAKVIMRQKNGKANIAIIPRGIDKETLTRASIDKGYALCIGRIDIYNKGIDLIINAWKKVVNEIPTAKLVIAGNGKVEDEKKLIDLIKEKRLEKNIKFVGRVLGERKRKLLAESSLIINGTKFGYFSNVCLEALSAGKTLVCFDIEGLDWIPSNLCIKVKKFDPNLLADSLIFLYKNKSIRKSYSKRARQFAKKFSWENITRVTDDFYKEVLN